MDTGTVSLSKRQQDVVALVAQGFTSKEIAEKLHLKKTYIDGICFFLCAKLSCKSRAQLVDYAHKNNLIHQMVK